MVAAGYMAKRVSTTSDWLGVDHVGDVYSVSFCISEPFADYMNYWKHNGYWFFDSPAIIQQLASEHGIDLAGTTLFFYEVHEQQFDEDQRLWVPFVPESFPTCVVLPPEKTLEGYDVVSFYVNTTPECSPLSCNGLAREIETNSHCLLPSFDRAQQLLNDGAFTRSEPGPFRIFAVYSVPWPASPQVSAA